MRTIRYKGRHIFECVKRKGEHNGHNGLWVVQTYQGNGTPYAHELCPHYRTIAQAKEAIRAAERALVAQEAAEEAKQ